MPGLYLLMYIERVPKASTSLVNAVSIPLMIDAINITVTTPIITPMIVKNDRSLLARSVARANQRFSRISLRNSFIIHLVMECAGLTALSAALTIQSGVKSPHSK